jgi:hypothetical protein
MMAFLKIVCWPLPDIYYILNLFLSLNVSFFQTIRSTKASTTLGAALPEDGIRVSFRTFAFFLNLDNGQSPKQVIVSVGAVKSPVVLNYNRHNIKVNLL